MQLDFRQRAAGAGGAGRWVRGGGRRGGGRGRERRESEVARAQAGGETVVKETGGAYWWGKGLLAWGCKGLAWPRRRAEKVAGHAESRKAGGSAGGWGRDGATPVGGAGSRVFGGLWLFLWWVCVVLRLVGCEEVRGRGFRRTSDQCRGGRSTTQAVRRRI